MQTINPIETLAKQTSVEPATQQFLDFVNSNQGPAIQELSIEQARGVLEGVQSGPVNKLDAQIEDVTILGGPTGTVNLRIVRPLNATGKLPVIMYHHGGGWILGSKETHDRLIRELAVGAHAAVVFVDYSRTPEVQYPIANEQSYAALIWVTEQGVEYGLDSDRIAVAGDSAGGNMTAAVTLMAKERSGPAIAAQVLFYPVTSDSFSNSSYDAFHSGYFLTRDAMKWIWEEYAPDLSTRNLPTVAPLKASLDQLSGLPQALVITGENDVLRDEGEAYAQKLSDAGVRVTATRYIGTIHDFVMLNPIAETPATRAAIAQASSYLREVFAK